MPADRAMLGALSEYVGHEGPTLLLCESRRADEHLQVSCARSSHTSEVSCSQLGKVASSPVDAVVSGTSHTDELPDIIHDILTMI